MQDLLQSATGRGCYSAHSYLTSWLQSSSRHLGPFLSYQVSDKPPTGYMTKEDYPCNLIPNRVYFLLEA